MCELEIVISTFDLLTTVVGNRYKFDQVYLERVKKLIKVKTTSLHVFSLIVFAVFFFT